MLRTKNPMQKKGFTLIELLVVISVVSLLMAILAPALARARQQCKGVVCLSNLRQMVIAVNNYLLDNEGYYPLAGFTENANGLYYNREWDFIKVFKNGKIQECKPGLLWQGSSILKIQQCPSFKGSANSTGDPYTGYNYNASYIGGVMRRTTRGKLHGMNSSKAAEVRMPSGCAIFGDGEYGSGANKYMRSPWVGKLDADYPSLRPYGTQGYRHLGKTNVAYCDGSAASVRERYAETYSSLKKFIAEGTGFLSPDNSAYDLK